MALLENQGQFVYHFRQLDDDEDYLVTIGVTPDSIVDIEAQAAEDAFTAWDTNLMGLISSGYTLVAVDTEVGTDIGTRRWTYTATSVFAGGRSGNALSQNTAYLIHKSTAGLGRGKNGRMYVPGVPDDKVSNGGTVTSGEQATWNTDLAAYYTQMMDDFGYLLVVNHQASSPLSPASVIISLSVDPTVATQRRRLRR